ncbi:MAG: hypothetical protein GY846_07950 [Deltaproteobacteria bacterium]|nr:hypothetical protein [Deltaproteobacteria bacterium]
MNKRCSKNLSVCLAALIILGSIIFATPAFAEPKVSIIGTILAPGEKGGVNAYVLWTQAQKWHFNIKEISAIDSLGTSPDGWSILHMVSPSQINIVGNKKIIQDFARKATPGKQFQIDGILYVADGVLFVGSINQIK